MRKVSVLLLALTIILLSVSPSMAVVKAAKPAAPKVVPKVTAKVAPAPAPAVPVKVKFNGREYVPTEAPRFIQGTLFTAASMVPTLLGADMTVNGSQVIITENDNKLRMNLGSTTAYLNDKSVTMPKASLMSNGIVYIPLRFVFEALSAKIEWRSITNTITIEREELRDGQSAFDILINSDKKADSVHHMTSDIESKRLVTAVYSSKVSTYSQTAAVNLKYQHNPEVSIIKSLETEVVDGKSDTDEYEIMSANGELYLHIPNGPWGYLSNDVEDGNKVFDILSDTPRLCSGDDMDDSGSIISLANDQTKDGKAYYVIEEVLGSKLLYKELRQSARLAKAIKENPDLEQMLLGARMDKTVRTFINKETGLADYYELDFKLTIKSNGKLPNGTLSYTHEVKMRMRNYAYNVFFTIPSTADAPDLREYMND
ncbi:MAG: copper amine oxidase N-terminal domain-containing protein [Acidobacteriota bacterium]